MAKDDPVDSIVHRKLNFVSLSLHPVRFSLSLLYCWLTYVVVSNKLFFSFF